MRQRESLFADKVDRDLEAMGAWYFNVTLVALRGIPDRVGCINGHFFALELKTKSGVASKLQRYILGKIREAGGFAEKVDPSNWDEIKASLLSFQDHKNQEQTK